MGKTAFFNRIRGVFGVEQPMHVAQYCQKHWPEETEHIIRVADEVSKNIFLFDFDWDMEQTHEPVIFEKNINWGLIPFGDREFLWQFNRMRFLMCLGQAYQITRKDSYAVHCVRLLRDWIERAEEGENVDLGPWRTLETGLRAEIWLRTLCLVEDNVAVDDRLILQVEKCIEKHIQRLMNYFDDHKYLSNWGVLESSGLLLWSVAADISDKERDAVQKIALERLVSLAKIQILPDGMQREQSPMYHGEVYACFRSALYYGEKSGIMMPEIIRSTVQKMAYVQGIWKKPDQTQFAQGDSDAFDVRDQITSGAFILRDPVLKFMGYEYLDFEDAWRFDYKACLEYENMESEAPGFISAQLPFSGNYYFRSGWEKDGNLLHFHCGGTGGGHGHMDKLHVNLVMNGEDILVDSGRFTYVDGEERYSLKEPSAHNTVIVDGKPFGQCETSWIYHKVCNCIKQGYHEGKNWGYVEGSHMGYIEDGLVVNRRVIWIKPDIYVIADYFYSTGKHKYETFFHFDRNAKVSLEGKTAHFDGVQTEAWLQSISSSGEASLCFGGQSKFYNEIEENKVYCERDAAEGNFHKIYVVNGGKSGSAAPIRIKSLPLYTFGREKALNVEEGEALSIKTDCKEYLLILCSQEITDQEILHSENCYGFGKAILFDRTEEKEKILTGEILEWW